MLLADERDRERVYTVQAVDGVHITRLCGMPGSWSKDSWAVVFACAGFENSERTQTTATEKEPTDNISIFGPCWGWDGVRWR